jgi:prepilin signal peptidase PulO-like enzyme (type II secretory pathway)
MLNKKAFSLSAGITWSLAVLALSIINLNFPNYSSEVLNALSGVYPGFIPGVISSVVIGPIYSFVDGVIGAYIFATIYNYIDKKSN